MKITCLVAASLLTVVSGQEGLLISNIRSDDPWCLTARERGSNDFIVGFNKCSPVATPFIIDGASTQAWRIEDNGRIRSSAFPTLCMTVATGSGGNVRGGDRIKLRDCGQVGVVNTFIHDADDATNTGPIIVEDFESFCLTNEGNAPHDTDPIRARGCQNEGQFQFTYDEQIFGNPDSECPVEAAALVNCVSNELSDAAATACLDCVVKGIEDLDDPSTCKEAVSDICDIIDMCSCGTCDDEIAELFDCVAGFSDAGCPLACLNPGLGDDCKYLISNIRFPRNSNWCITRRRRFLGRDEAVLARCFFDDVATPFADFEEADQRWLVEVDGLIRSDAGDNDLCLAVDGGNDEIGGNTIVLVDCERELAFNRFTFDGGTGPIGVFPTDGRLCLTNRGSRANRGDPIRVERCRPTRKFQFTYENEN